MGGRQTTSREGDGRGIRGSSADGFWSIGRRLVDGWPKTWDHGVIDKVERIGPWLVATGHVDTPWGNWQIRDQWRISGTVLEGSRRWTWKGNEPSPRSVLSVGWVVPGHSATLLLPGVLYHGNPAGQRYRKAGWDGLVPEWTGTEGERLQVEEHRLPQPWASFEWEAGSGMQLRLMAALHSHPSAPSHGTHPDLSWTLGAEAVKDGTLLQLLSGAVALNGRTGVVKSGQAHETSFTDVAISVPPNTCIEKRYRLQANVTMPGAGFRAALSEAMEHADLSADGLPRIADIIDAKVRHAQSRWSSNSAAPGFAMLSKAPNLYHMGGAGQADALGYAFQVLAKRLGRPDLRKTAYDALEVLATAKFTDQGFFVELNGETKVWSKQSSLSQGQAMSTFARAIRVGRAQGAATNRWMEFLANAVRVHADRILAPDWNPQSTAEAFFIQPLCLVQQLLGMSDQRSKALKAAIKAGTYYAKRHVGPKEPFYTTQWEDKEGAWAGLEPFLALYEVTKDSTWLSAASHAADMLLTYTYLWNVILPPSLLRDHDFQTRGWTSDSVLNNYLDTRGVLYAPLLWRLGSLGRPSLLRLAELMYRSCGQVIDAYGSQGEQFQQTRFAQEGDSSHVNLFRGGYVEDKTPFWITAHFLTAAVQFEEIGVLGELWSHS